MAFIIPINVPERKKSPGSMAAEIVKRRWKRANIKHPCISLSLVEPKIQKKKKIQTIVKSSKYKSMEVQNKACLWMYWNWVRGIITQLILTQLFYVPNLKSNVLLLVCGCACMYASHLILTSLLWKSNPCCTSKEPFLCCTVSLISFSSNHNVLRTLS